MNRRKIAAAIIVLVVIGVGLLIFFANRGSQSANATLTPTATTQATANATATPAGASSQANTAATIRFASNGFSPATLTVAVGTAVTFTNDSSDAINIESNPHPTHTDHPFLNLGEIAPGQSKTVTITTAGTLGYHDHPNPSITGTIVAQ